MTAPVRTESHRILGAACVLALLAAAGVIAYVVFVLAGWTALVAVVAVPPLVAAVVVRWRGRRERAVMLADWRDQQQRKADADRALFAVVQRQRREAARAGGTS